MPRRQILLLVTGGIAAYKSALLTRLLVQAGFGVRVAMTAAATRFVTPLTFRVLSGAPVPSDLWGDADGQPMDHIELARAADLVVVAPATANTLAKAAAGIADDLVTTLLLVNEGPLLLAPAMNDAMWRHPATRANLDLLRRRGAEIVGPAEGFLACGTEAAGRMAEPEVIVAEVERLCRRRPGQAAGAAGAADAGGDAAGPWRGRRVLVTAGPTREPIDPVRYVANRSTGTFGYALAAEAVRLGAEVTLISGPVALPRPAGLSGFVPVLTSEEMGAAVAAALDAGVDWLIMAAAVADFRPAHPSPDKLKKESIGTSWNLEMTRTLDVLGEVVEGRRASGLRVVGFALETSDLVPRALEKLKAKGMDFVVANDLGAPDSAFGAGRHRVVLIGPGGALWESPVADKAELARGLLGRLAAAATAREPGGGAGG